MKKLTPGVAKTGNMRWFIVVFFMMAVILNYIDRNTLGILANEIINNLHITTEQYSYILAAFQAAYTLSQPIVGWFIDSVGLKIGFAVMILIWSLATVFHAGVTNWIQLAFARFIMGGSESAAMPATAKVLTEWFPKKERSIANGWAMVGFSLGGMIAPPLIYFIHKFGGWQLAFVVPGLMGIVLGLCWFKFYNPPAKMKHISEEEKDYILSDQDTTRPQKRSLLKALASVAKEKKFYGIAIPAFLAEPAWATVNFWVPLYLMQERGMELKDLAMFFWIPFLAADFGGLVGGYIARYLNNFFHISRVNSAIFTYMGAAILMLSMALTPLVQSPHLAIIMIAIGAFAHQMISSMLTLLVMEEFPPDQVATVNGFRGSCAWTASFIFTLVLGQFLGKIGYAPFFIAMGFFDIIGVTIVIIILFQRKKPKPSITAGEGN